MKKKYKLNIHRIYIFILSLHNLEKSWTRHNIEFRMASILNKQRKLLTPMNKQRKLMTQLCIGQREDEGLFPRYVIGTCGRATVFLGGEGMQCTLLPPPPPHLKMTPQGIKILNLPTFFRSNIYAVL